MSESAHITAIDVLERFRQAMLTFRNDAAESLAGAAMVVQRYVEWIEHDRVKFWETQIRRGWERIAEARADLERCQGLAMEGERKSCHEEQEALDAAKRRLRRAEEQLDAVRHWRNKLHHEIVEYQARAGRLAGWLETEHPKAIAALERMYAALAAYVTMAAPTDAPATDGVASGDSVARTAGEATAPTPAPPVPPSTAAPAANAPDAPAPPPEQTP
jgi:hypothetical protein